MRNPAKVGIGVVIAVLIVVAAYTAVVLTRSSPEMTTSTGNTSSSNSIGVVNIGYYANINHAPAVLGISSGAFQKALGPSTTINTFLFTSGGPEMTALLAGKLDMAYVGPDPAVNAYIQSNGTGLTIIAGVSSGGAVFVIQNDSGITSPNDLGGETFAAPGLGNTQDIALRYYLMEHGFNTTTNGGNVTIVDTTNANIVTLFAQGRISGAWVPEPYGEVLIQQFGGKLFVDEGSLWPGGNFSTTELVARTQFLQQHPDVVKDVVSADVNETIWINKNPSLAETDLNATLAALTGQGYSQSILSASLAKITFTYDPIESSVAVQAEHAYALGDLTKNPTNLSDLYNLTILNIVLTADGLPTVQ
jgi:NitT/TauT family transport system substrate-binding protein